MAEQKKQFNPEVAFWPTKSGNGYRVYVDEKVKAELERVEVGGSLYLKETPPGRIKEKPTAPHFTVVFLTAEGGKNPAPKKQADESL